MYNFLKKTSIDLTSAGNGSVLLGTPLETHIPPLAVIKLANLDSAAGGSASISIGSNSPNYNNCLAAQDIFHLDMGLNGIKVFPMKMLAIKNNPLYMKVNSTITGVFTVDVHLVGFQPSVEDVPVGSVRIWTGGATPPSGSLFPNGDAVSRTTYADLFAVIGTTFGAGDGSTTFNLPNIPDLDTDLRYIIKT